MRGVDKSEARRPPRSGDKVAHYRILEELGRGGMGVVYRALDLSLGREVALKCPRGGQAENPKGRHRFLKEGRAASLLSHPGIVPIFEVFEADGLPWFAMELAEGGSLAVLLQARGPLPCEEVVRLAETLAEALQAAHNKHILHRDINPRNILVSEDGHARLTDFGLARTFVPPEELSLISTQSSDERENGRVVGTPGYMSPEQALGKNLDPRTDIFSLGAVLYEACTGRPAFASSERGDVLDAILNRAPPAIGRFNYDIHEEMERIIRKCLAKRRRERYQHADELLADVRALRRRHGIGAAPADPRVSPARRRWPKWLAVGAGASILAAFAAQWVVHPRVPVPAAPPRHVVAVLPFDDATGGPEGELRARMMADLLAADLSESASLRSVGFQRVSEIVDSIPAHTAQSDVMKLVAASVRVDWIVTGSVYKLDDAYLASVEIFKPGKAAPYGSFRVGAARSTALMRLAAGRLKGLLSPDEAFADSRAPPLAAISSLSEPARANEHLGRMALQEDRYQEAIGRFSKALELDPRFTSAAIRLAEALNRAGYGKRAEAAADRALRLVEGPGAQATPRLVLEARAMDARIRGTHFAEIEVRRALASRYGDDPDLLLGLSEALLRGSAPDEALPIARQALALDSKDPRSYLAAADVLKQLGRYRDAAAELSEANRLYTALESTGGRGRVALHRGHLFFARDDHRGAALAYAEAASLFRQTGLDVLAAQADKASGDVALAQGSLAEARRAYDSAILAAHAGGNRRLAVSVSGSLGGQLYIKGKYKPAEEMLRRSVAEARDLDNVQLLLPPLLTLASLLNYTGRAGEGRALAAEAVGFARSTWTRSSEITALALLADAEYQQGRLRASAASYEDLIRIERAPGGCRANLARWLMGLASLRLPSGTVQEAHDAATESVDIEREIGNSAELGYALTVSAAAHRHLCLWEEADSNLQEADRIARRGRARLEHLASVVVLERGLMASMQGNLVSAEKYLDQAIHAGQASGAVSLSVPALSAASDVARRRGRSADAVRLARRALEHPRALAGERITARAYLAAALAGAEEPEDAAVEARRALDEAESMGLPLEAALAAHVIGGLSPPDKEALLTRGRSALENYLASAPRDRRKVIMSRADVAEIADLLETGSSRFASPAD